MRAPALGVALLVGLVAAGPAGAGEPSEEELLPAGRYRLEMRLASRVELPRIGDLAGATASISEAQVVHDAGAVRQRHRVCALWDASETGWGGLDFPDAFVAALDRPRYAVSLRPSADGRFRYRADLGVERIGFLADAQADEDGLPTAAGDPRVLDWDGDGWPGATLRLRIPLVPDAELWIVQRGRAVLDGVVVAPGRIEGRVHVVDFSQQVIGARPGFLQHTPRHSPDPEGSRFALVRMEAGSGCADLRDDAPPSSLATESAS